MDKNKPRQRGRPRLFDEAEVLQRAQRIFLARGFEATAYEEIALSTGLSKPSLYNTFGDKTALFERTIDGYARQAHQMILASFAAAPTLAEATKQMLLAAADVYAEPDRPSTGCLLVGTALPGCTQNETIQKTLSGFIASLESDLEAVIAERYAVSVEASGRTPRMLSLHVSSMLFSLAVRARTGVSRRKLRKIAGELSLVLAE